MFRRNWARTTLMLAMLTLFGTHTVLEEAVQLLSDGVSILEEWVEWAGKPIKIPARKWRKATHIPVHASG